MRRRCAALTAIALAACSRFATNPAAPQNSEYEHPASKRPAIYVANAVYQQPSLTAYARDGDGNVPPVRTIAGSNTQLAQPSGLAIDSHGQLYVANAFGGGTSGLGSVLVFASGADGNVSPVATITEDVNDPFAVALDSSGNVYVANWQGQSITEYAAGSYGLVREIVGDNTGLEPMGVAVDSNGKIYAVNNCEGSCESSITVYARDATNNASPMRTISGAKTKLTYPPGGIAVDSHGEVVVSNASYSGLGGVFVFARTAHGDVKPIRAIIGSRTKLHEAYGLALSRGKIYVTSGLGFYGPGRVLVFPLEANGNVAPMQQIRGSKTGLSSVSGLALR